jgi:hypothetical protein
MPKNAVGVGYAFTSQTNAALSPARRQRGVSKKSRGSNDRYGPFVSGQPLSLADGNALSPGTTASCL